MIAYIALAIVFLAFYSAFASLRRWRDHLHALRIQPNQPITIAPQPQAPKSGPSTPPQYTCIMDGQQRQYKRGSPEYELIQDAIRRM